MADRTLTVRASVGRFTAIGALLASAALGAACSPPLDPGEAPAPEPTPPEPLEIELASPCEAPVEGFDRLQSVAAERGLDLVFPEDDSPRSCLYVPGGVVASDLDLDGDPDLLFSRPQGFPHLYSSEGGQLSAEHVEHDTVELFGRETLAQAAADLDGDGLPEVLLVGEGFVAVSHNEGELSFTEPELIHFESTYPVTCYQSLAVGDVDGDGDLDLALPGLDPVLAPGAVPESVLPASGTWDLLLLSDGAGGFETVVQLDPAGQPWLSMLALFTDRDADGDLDLLVASDRSRDGRPPAAFHRNDGLDGAGLPLLEDDAAELGADLHSCSMGLASVDLNGDSLPDYCISDLLSELRCMLSDGSGSYFEGGLALGLVAHPEEHPDWDPLDAAQWSPWSVEAIDLDNDGFVDMAAAAGPPPGPAGVAESFVTRVQPDALWQGSSTGFSDRSWTQGFGDASAHYGLASTDLDRDGHRELVLGAWGGPAVLWANPCSDAAWVTVVLEGLAGNSQGFGSRVEVESGGTVRVQELHALRTVGQSSPELHFGLGGAQEVDRLEVHWPDGALSVLEDLPVRAVLRVRHPERAQP